MMRSSRVLDLSGGNRKSRYTATTNLPITLVPNMEVNHPNGVMGPFDLGNGLLFSISL